MMSVKLYLKSLVTPRFILSFDFITLGSWCLLAPRQVLTLSFLSPPLLPVPVLLTQCFGAQAMLCGLLLGTANMTSKSFKYFGLATLPFFGFNYYYVFVNQLCTKLMALDLLSNCLIVGCCWWGYNVEKEKESEGKKKD
ncbi:hypothetical protein BKA69DRAFT_1058363 [Paraphysoderma sedebokerense]|nr:hypothetical protein BKA69DRAFT_1058363 [Paraphysoderma sedebokerense]